MYIRIFLAVMLALGMFAVPATATAEDERATHIEIEPSRHYNPDDLIWNGYMSNAGDNDDDMVVRAKIDGTDTIASDDFVFELWENPYTDMNDNGRSGEKLYTTGGITHSNDRRWINFGNWFFASENIPMIYKDNSEHKYLEDLDRIPQPGLPTNGNYTVKILYRGIPGKFNSSQKVIKLHMCDNRHPTHIEIMTPSYSDNTNIFTTNRQACDPQFNLAGKTLVDDISGEFIRNTLYFELWEQPNTNRNGNGRTGKYLYREADDAGFQSYSQVNVACWFKDITEVKCLPNGRYFIKILSPGERWYKSSNKTITLDIGP